MFSVQLVSKIPFVLWYNKEDNKEERKERMRMNTKKILSLGIAALMAVSLSACGGNDDGDIYKGSEIPSYTEREIAEGTYIKKTHNDQKGVDSFQPLLATPLESDNRGNFYTWFTSKYDDLIPRFQEGDQIVFYSETKRPTSYTLYRMKDMDYTLGILFNVRMNEGDINRPTIISFSGTYNEMSPVCTVVPEAIGVSSADIQITEINEKEFSTNILADDSFLKGLTAQTMYNIGFYCGTVFKQVMVKADTHLFIQENTSVTSSYVELKDKYFEIILPSNMDTGFYYMEGVGMFRYEGKTNPIEDDMEPIVSGEESQAEEPVEPEQSQEQSVEDQDV